MYLGRGDEADTGVVLRGGRPEPCEDTLREEGDARDVTTGDVLGERDASGLELFKGGVAASILVAVATGGGATAALPAGASVGGT